MKILQKLGIGILFCLTIASASGAVFTVGDISDASSVSLRQAIINANAQPGADEIRFNIPGTGPFTIIPATPLPVVTDPITLDATTQPGYSGTPVIRLSGELMPTATGVDIEAGPSIVRGLWVYGFIGIEGNEISLHDSNGNTVQSCYLTPDLTGISEGGNLLEIYNSNGNLIGGSGRGNVISGGGQCINLYGTSNNRIESNLIGTNFAGTGPFFVGSGPSYTIGILLSGGSNLNTIGGTTASLRNVIGGVHYGIQIGQTCTTNSIQGNYIGTNIGGSAAIPISEAGIAVQSNGSKIGGNAPAQRNVISGCQIGILFYTTDQTVIQGNYLGTNAAGTAALPNQWAIVASGINGYSTRNLLIGGSEPGEGNLISGNSAQGICLYGLNVFDVTIQGNKIGTDASGQFTLANHDLNIGIANDAHDILIGGEAPGASNVIAYDSTAGIGLWVDTSQAGGYPQRIRISRNRIYGNKGWNIDLARSNSDRNGSPNDHLDGDAGPNGEQNYPIINSLVNIGGGQLRLTGNLDSVPNKTYRLEFFTNAALGTKSQGEAGAYAGSLDVTTGADGQAGFNFMLPSLVSGQYVTATATDPDGNTSELAVPVRLLGVVSGIESGNWFANGL